MLFGDSRWLKRGVAIRCGNGRLAAMKIAIITALLVVCCLPIVAQAPAPADTKTPPAATAAPVATAPSAATPAPTATAAPVASATTATTVAPATTTTHSDPLGFSYALPADWQILDLQPAMPTIRQRADQQADSEEEKKGVNCSQITFTARHGDPPSVILAITLPFECWGTVLKDSDLAGFAMGASEGIKKTWDISDPQYGAYRLGSHSIWIERAMGTPVDHPETKKRLEIVCSILKKGAVCWMAFAPDDEAMKVFERGSVVLEDDSPAPLVPANAFAVKP